ncbi:remorin 4.1-like isoform X2 [Curcuma longa]|uniref:remorin 4.1-like isoform X2 n=1 Tax=Curcuma longa TaxID=136217 RepID=UPI003D9ED05E
MLSDPRQARSGAADHENTTAGDTAEFRDIHALGSANSHPSRGRRGDHWEGGSVRSSASLSVGSVDGASEGGFTSMSREFNALVVAGSNLQQQQNDGGGGAAADEQLTRIGEDELEETNPLAIVPDNNPFPSPRRPPTVGGGESSSTAVDGVPVHVVKKEEAESKIAAWQIAEVAKINNRFKREEVTINGWESDQRKLDEQRAKATEKMQNDVAKAHQKAAEKRASAESKRGTKVAKVLELANFMRAVGRAPSKRSFF